MVARKPKESGVVKSQPAAKRAVRKTKAPIPLKSMQQVRIGKQTYSLVRDPGCAICTHPARVDIEEQILLKTGYSAIARMFSEKQHERHDGETDIWPKISAEQVSEHFNADHCPIDAYVLHDLVQQAQEGMPEDYAKLGNRIIDGAVFAKAIIGRVEERVVRGEIQPTMKDGIAAARIDTALKIAAMRAEGENEDGHVSEAWFYEQSFDVFFTEAQRIMAADDWLKFMEVLRNHPVLRSLIDKRQKMIEQASGEMSA